MKLFVRILALVRGFNAHHPLPGAITESLERLHLAQVRLKCDAAVDEFSALYLRYATGELTPTQYWQTKKALLDQERAATRQTVHG
ncbi:hypothetical protein EHF33_20500 (plasmid) [Deinococcus psychrotolerans]|uniref:Uncharacterized protein n=1 Tax=Deinococcus psychrotolerans TaxID=2489213 RepID=A0A3G8YJ71_9DEIO|nr:hypothetical protein [Deinococcus psychrotolerans]AZI45292.1 hypothetical protein EHF33_20500 [Deinococcus psychrotolerans]